jgi:hypothetical protein
MRRQTYHFAPLSTTYPGMDYIGNEPGASAMRRRQRPELLHGVSLRLIRRVGSVVMVRRCVKGSTQ